MPPHEPDPPADFRALVEAASEPVAVARDGRIVFANAAMAECFGHASAEALGHGRVGEDDPPVARDGYRFARGLDEGAEVGGRLGLVRRHGSGTVVEISRSRPSHTSARRGAFPSPPTSG